MNQEKINSDTEAGENPAAQAWAWSKDGFYAEPPQRPQRQSFESDTIGENAYEGKTIEQQIAELQEKNRELLAKKATEYDPKAEAKKSQEAYAHDRKIDHDAALNDIFHPRNR